MNCGNDFDHFSFTMSLLLSSMWLSFIGIEKCTNAYAYDLCDFVVVWVKICPTEMCDTRPMMGKCFLKYQIST